MPRLTVFNGVSLDGYFTDKNGDMSWAHAAPDPEWNDFVSGNSRGDGALVFGRVTYEMMAGFWPTPQAMQSMPDVARGMNALPKFVFSRTLARADWNNTTLLKGDAAEEMRRLKRSPGKDMVILGSGSIVAQLTQAGLIDGYTVVVTPIVLGAGRTLFDGVARRPLRLTSSRAFRNGNVVLTYEPVAADRTH